MTHKFKILIVAVVVFSAPNLIAQTVTKEILHSHGKDRAYYLFVPDNLDKAKPAPLIVLMHGSGRTGDSLVDKWKNLAKREGIILVGPDTLDAENWQIPQDAPDPLYDLIEGLKAKYPVDARRVYLFGHSAGAVSGLFVSLLESEYFAAAAMHAGAINQNKEVVDRSKRKIPIAIYVGTDDRFFPLDQVRATRDLLNSHGFNAQLTEMKGRTHDYYSHSDEVNRMAWDFLKGNSLSADPRYENYAWGK